MRANGLVVSVVSAVIAVSLSGLGQRPTEASAQATTASADDPVKTLVGRLDLEKYKATIKSLTEFGDRLEGTDRNKAAIDWIEAQLRSYGCATERLKYVYAPTPPSPETATQPTPGPPPARSAVIASGEIRTGPGGSRQRGTTRPVRPEHRSQCADRPGASGAQLPADHTRPARAGVLHEDRRHPSRRNVHRRRSHGRTRLR